jgi:hypothetical protein
MAGTVAIDAHRNREDAVIMAIFGLLASCSYLTYVVMSHFARKDNIAAGVNLTGLIVTVSLGLWGHVSMRDHPSKFDLIAFFTLAGLQVGGFGLLVIFVILPVLHRKNSAEAPGETMSGSSPPSDRSK